MSGNRGQKNQKGDQQAEEGTTIALRKLMEVPAVLELFRRDPLSLIADNYNLALALIYMWRANTAHTPSALFTALFLAHEVEEDEEGARQELIRLTMGPTVTDSGVSYFLHRRAELWTKLRYSVIVDKESCDQVIACCLPVGASSRKRRADSEGQVLPYKEKERVFVNVVRIHFTPTYGCLIRCVRYVKNFKRSLKEPFLPTSC